MANKLETYVQMAGQTAADVTKRSGDWTGFLATTSRLYRYTFPDQLLIHAQRPKATACASFDVWNKKMRRYVRSGSKGIALVNVQDGRPSLRYVFDVSDTRAKKGSYSPYLWEYKAKHQDAVIKALENYYGIVCNDEFVAYLGHLATHLVKNYWKNYKIEITDGAQGSLLEGMDERSLRVKFCCMASYSITYILLLRCGFRPGNYLSTNVFQGISDFNTTRIIKILGHAVSQASGEILHQVAVAIFEYERQEREAGKPTANANTDPRNTETPSSFTITVDNGKPAQPTIQEVYNKYKPIVEGFLKKDKAYQNACKNSDKENAFLEGIEAVKRAALAIKDLAFMKLFYDLSEFHARMQQEVLAETYLELSNKQEPDTKIPQTNAGEEHTEKQPTGTETKKPQGIHTPEPETAGAAEEKPHVSRRKTSNGELQKNVVDTKPKEDTKDEQGMENPGVSDEKPQATILDESEVEEIQPAYMPENFRITDIHLGEGSAKEKFLLLPIYSDFKKI